MSTPSPLFDATLAAKRAGGDEALVKTLCHIMAKDIQTQLPLIEASYQQHDWDNLHDQLHRLHGACCYMGLPRLEMLLKQALNALKANAQSALLDHRAPLIECLKQTYNNLTTEST